MTARPATFADRCRRQFRPLSTAAVVVAVLAGSSNAPAAEPELVALADVAPTIRQDIRYATRRNFMAQVLPGYRAGKCLLRPEVANALRRAQAWLAKSDPPRFGLKVFDCYRPMRAVRAMVRWTHSNGGSEAPFHYPAHKRSRLVALGYISDRSSHARGFAVDLTLVAIASGEDAAKSATDTDDVKPAQTCRERGGDPTDPSEVDMGTTFDCFDVASATRSGDITDLQHKNRAALVSVMSRFGFRNYAREWWHFTYIGRVADGVLDVVIE
jgi:D-alanyl-D-alanine dipeptidase